MASIRKDIDKIINETPICFDCKDKLQTVFKEYWRQKRKGRL